MGRSSSSSSQATNYETNNIDRRLVIGNEALGVAADNSNVAVNISSSDPGTVARALDSVDIATASVSGGVSQLLGTAERLFNRTTEANTAMAGKTEQAVLDAYKSAAADKAGGIDQRTIIVLAVAGAAAVYAISRKRS